MQILKVKLQNVSPYHAHNDTRIRYVLEFISTFYGIRVEPSPEGLTLPTPQFDSWTPNNIRVTYIDTIPVLYTDQQPTHIISTTGHVGFDLIGATFFLLSLSEELKFHTSRFRSSLSLLHRFDLLHTPLINLWLIQIEHHLRTKGYHLPPRWPTGKFAIVLTHDIDRLGTVEFTLHGKLRRIMLLNTMKHLTLHTLLNSVGAPLHYLLRKGLRMYSPTIVNPDIGDWITCESQYGWRSTFFIFPDKVYPRDPSDPIYTYHDKTLFHGKPIRLMDLLRELKPTHDIGLHASRHSYNNFNALRMERRRLSQLIGNVDVVRHHYISFDAYQSPATLEAAGFTIDSSLGWPDNVGFRAAVAYPFKLWDHTRMRSTTVWEVPLTLQESIAIVHLGLDTPAKLWSLIDKLIHEASRSTGILTLLFHPAAIDMPFDTFKFYRELLTRLSHEDAWITTISGIKDWLSQRTPR